MDTAIEILDIENLLISSQQRKQDVKDKRNAIEKKLTLRVITIETYFLRLSWIHKVNYLKGLLTKIKSIDCLKTIINTINNVTDKMASYLKVTPHTNFVYDIILQDHDRAMDEGALQESIKKDAEWFATLKDDEQVKIIIGLLRASGSGVIKETFIRLLQICNDRIQILHGQPYEETNEETTSEGKEATPEQSDEAPRGSQLQKNEDIEIKYDPTHPLSIEVAKREKIWKDTISKYKLQLEAAEKATDYIQRGKKKERDSFGSIKSKTSKKSSSKVSKATPKNTKQENDLEIDWIQLLPIWTVKQIFNYLDLKTLKKIKDVNSYWNYAVTDLMKDRKIRDKLNTVIDKIERAIDPIYLEEILKDRADRVKALENKVAQPMTFREKKLSLLLRRAAILPSMVPVSNGANIISKSLEVTAPLETKRDYLLPVEYVTTFPRFFIPDMPIYKEIPCFLKDVNVAFNEERELERQKSSLIFNLSDKTSSSKSIDIISTNTNLGDW